MNFKHRAKFGLFLLVWLIFFMLFGSFFCSFDPCSACLEEKNIPPTFIHWFGTDDLGRDLFARTLQGLRISLSIGLLAAIIDLIIGGLWGTLAGFAPRSVETIMMRVAEIIYSIPYLLLVILVSVFIGTGILPILTAMICIGWIHMSRIVRHLVLQSQKTDYILAARALGVSKNRQFFAHMIPNIIGPIMAACMLSIPHAIFTEAFLSFLGIGIQPPLASLGSMVSDAIPAMRFYPWRLIFPAGAISTLILSIMLIADSLRDYYDPKQRIMPGRGL
jgi:oligopeptide transport system permease protein